jgi:hypothetical protein
MPAPEVPPGVSPEVSRARESRPQANSRLGATQGRHSPGGRPVAHGAGPSSGRATQGRFADEFPRPGPPSVPVLVVL